MNIKFTKFQGTGNDFIIIDDREGLFPDTNVKLIKKLCDRRFGIGADGLMLLQSDEKYDFKMRYFNSDGPEGSMCGNGGRCLVAFAHGLGVFEKFTKFDAIDGLHEAEMKDNGDVKLKMSEVKQIEKGQGFYYLDTGSPHYVEFNENVTDLNVFEEGRKVRYNDRFKEIGTNVNFVQLLKSGQIDIRTYERGVEDETFSCGTGSVAAGIVSYLNFDFEEKQVFVNVKGGNLKVYFETSDNKSFSNIWLEGPATKVFEGEISF